MKVRLSRACRPWTRAGWDPGLVRVAGPTGRSARKRGAAGALARFALAGEAPVIEKRSQLPAQTRCASAGDGDRLHHCVHRLPPPSPVHERPVPVGLQRTSRRRSASSVSPERARVAGPPPSATTDGAQPSRRHGVVRRGRRRPRWRAATRVAALGRAAGPGRTPSRGTDCGDPSPRSRTSAGRAIHSADHPPSTVASPLGPSPRLEGEAMTDKTSTIIWTQIDEAPALATYSLLPIVQAFTKGTGVVGRDAGHLAGRPDHRQLPREPDRGAADPGLPRRSSASSRTSPRPTSSSCRTSPPRSRSSRRRSRSCRRTATRSRTTPRTRRTTPRRPSRRASRRSSAAP